MNKEVFFRLVAELQIAHELDMFLGDLVATKIVGVAGQGCTSPIVDKVAGSFGPRVGQKIQEHGLVIPHEGNHRAIRLQLEEDFDDLTRLRPAVNVVAKKHHRTLGS